MNRAMSNASVTGLVANTWAERGISVPFTTPALSQARMRLEIKDVGFALLIGVAWWATILRGRLRRGEAGVPGTVLADTIDTD